MDPVTIIGIAAALVFGFLYLQSQNARTALAERVRELETKKTRRDSKTSSTDSSSDNEAELQKTIEAKDEELGKLRADLKKAKKRAHKSETEAKELQEQVADYEAKQAAFTGVDETRDQMMEAMTEAANLRQTVATLEAELSAYRDTSAADVSVEASEDVDAEALARIEGKYKAQIAKLEAQVKALPRELRQSFNDQVKSERDKTKGELRDLRRRLGRTLADMDKERRRAENTDKAYGILKNQLEATLDRLASVDASLRRPEMLTPQPRKLEQAEDIAPPADGEEKVAATAEPPMPMQTEAPADADAEPTKDEANAADDATAVSAADVSSDAAEDNEAIAESDEATDDKTAAAEETDSSARGDADGKAAQEEAVPEADDEAADDEAADDEAADDEAASAADADTASDDEKSASARLASDPLGGLDDLDAGWELDDEVMARITGSHKAVE